MAKPITKSQIADHITKKRISRKAGNDERVSDSKETPDNGCTK